MDYKTNEQTIEHVLNNTSTALYITTALDIIEVKEGTPPPTMTLPEGLYRPLTPALYQWVGNQMENVKMAHKNGKIPSSTYKHLTGQFRKITKWVDEQKKREEDYNRANLSLPLLSEWADRPFGIDRPLPSLSMCNDHVDNLINAQIKHDFARRGSSISDYLQIARQVYPEFCGKNISVGEPQTALVAFCLLVEYGNRLWWRKTLTEGLHKFLWEIIGKIEAIIEGGRKGEDGNL